MHVHQVCIGLSVLAHGGFALSWSLKPSKIQGPLIPRVAEARVVKPRAAESFAVASAFDRAISELEQLESRPYCHRIATALLVKNCQQLFDVDTASEVDSTSSRDLVDAYAISLAICDLERGRIPIPYQCKSFQETSLAKLSPRKSNGLHVSSEEVNQCIQAFAVDNKMWETWHNYRHRTEVYCQVAGADREKDSTVQFYKHIASIMAEFFDSVDKNQDRLSEFHKRHLNDANTAYEKLFSNIEDIQDAISTLRSHISQSNTAAEEAITMSKTRLENMNALENHISTSMDLIEKTGRTALHRYTQKFDMAIKALEPILDAIAVAATSTASLNKNMDSAMTNVAGLSELLLLLKNETDTSIAKQLHMQNHLNAMKSDIDAMHHGLSHLGVFVDTLFDWLGVTKWWPYLACPFLTIWAGSYQLKPSFLRNLILLFIGEILAVAIFQMQSLDAYRAVSKIQAAIVPNI